MAACATCGRAEDACRLANDKVGVALRHDYQPGRPLRPTVVAGAHELCPSPQRTHLRGWRERVAELRRPAPDQLPLDGGKQ